MEARRRVRSSARLSGEAAAARTPSSSGNGGPGRPAVDAAAAAQRRARAAERAREVEDSPRVLREKCRRLARALRNAKHLVVYTGAGISTAADIPDYRGPHGVWTRLQRGETIGRVEVSRAVPTFTHMALTALWARGTLKFVVSQNCDGLHVRAGLPRRALAELHGDMFAEHCAACRRVYLRAFDTTERTARHAHGTRRACHACGAELRDSIVHFGERGRAAWPLNWAGALRHAARADVVLCLGSSLKVLRRYPRLWRMHAPPHHRPALYIVNLQWTPKDAVAKLKINARCDAVMRQVARRLRLRVPRYRAESDPLLAHAEPLAPGEAHTTRRPLLPAPRRAPPPAPPAPLAPHDLLSSPSASDSDEELPLRRLAERLRASDRSSPDDRPRALNGHGRGHEPDSSRSSDTEPSLPEPPSPAAGPPAEPELPAAFRRPPTPDEESRSRDARLLPPDPGPSPPPMPSQDTSPIRIDSPGIRPSTPKAEPFPPELLSVQSDGLSTGPGAPPPQTVVPKSEEPASPTKISPTARRPLPDLLRAFQVNMVSGEATILLRAAHAPPPAPRPITHAPRPNTHSPRPNTHAPRPNTHSPRPNTHALRTFRMVRPRAPPPPAPATNGLDHFTIKKEEPHKEYELKDETFVKSEGPLVKSEGPLVKSEGPLVKSQGPLLKSEWPLVKKEAPDDPKPEEGGLGSRLRRLLECEPRLGQHDKPASSGDSSGEEGGARALAAAYIARAVLVCRAQLYPGLHTIIAPPAIECAWCYRRHAARRCLWYGPPRCTPPARRRRVCACCDAAAPPRPPTPVVSADDATGGGWYGKGYRKGRRRRR